MRTFDDLHLAYDALIELEPFKRMQKDCFLVYHTCISMAFTPGITFTPETNYQKESQASYYLRTVTVTE